MAKVDIYLPIESTDEWIHILSIPHSDIKRFTFRPLKWLRFAVFAVCGAKGHLSTTPGGDIADYENVLLDDLEDAYYYTPDGTYHFVDFRASDDRDTIYGSSISPQKVSPQEDFLKAVQDRDHRCAFTRRISNAEAAHIIPRSKGDAYITFVVRARFALYERLPFSRDEALNIDLVENGMLLRADLHVDFGEGDIAFLRTPNFAMGPDDVPSTEQQGFSSDRTTLQWMVDPALEGGYDFVPQRDAPPGWSNQARSPPAILLDYVYGAAVVKHWKTDNLLAMLEEFMHSSFHNPLAKEQKAPDSNPLSIGKQNRRKKSSRGASEGLLEAMGSLSC